MAKKNQQIITGLGDGDVGEFVFLPGDPGRVPKISAGWQDVQEVARTREYVVHTGFRDGVRLTAASTGIGAPSTAIMVEELVKLGAKTLIRIGNSGAVSESVQLGDYVISTGAVRDEGTSKSYVPAEYPAVAHYEVVTALVQAGPAHPARPFTPASPCRWMDSTPATKSSAPTAAGCPWPRRGLSRRAGAIRWPTGSARAY
jgi:uridine phosphorylase